MNAPICIISGKPAGDRACNTCPARLSANISCAYKQYEHEIMEAEKEAFLTKVAEKAKRLKDVDKFDKREK